MAEGVYSRHSGACEMRPVLFVAPIVLAGCASAPAVPDEAGAATFVIERDLLGSMTARGLACLARSLPSSKNPSSACSQDRPRRTESSPASPSTEARGA